MQCNAGLNSREKQLSLEKMQNMVLFHLSDESDNHDVSMYANFGAVYRNYWRDNVNQSLVYLSKDESPPEPSHSRELMAAERYSAYSGCDYIECKHALAVSKAYLAHVTLSSHKSCLALGTFVSKKTISRHHRCSCIQSTPYLIGLFHLLDGPAATSGQRLPLCIMSSCA